MNDFLFVIFLTISFVISLYLHNIWFVYIILAVIILAYFLCHILINPTEILFPYNFIIENLYEKKVFYTEEEKKKIFPTSEILERNWKKIKDEFKHIQKKKNIKNIGEKFITEKKEFWEGWTSFELRSFDKDNEENMKQCPILSRILKNDSNISTAFFSILKPGKSIPSHYGPFKGILRYHLGIEIPPSSAGDCFISVDGETYDWKNGEGILFDESYKHFVKNDTSYSRVILFIDVRRPFYFPYINDFILFLMSISPYNT